MKVPLGDHFRYWEASFKYNVFIKFVCPFFCTVRWPPVINLVLPTASLAKTF